MTASRVDSNQPEIVATLRGMGCSVQHLHAVGKGCPDLLVGLRGVNLLVEVKIEGGKINAMQQEWHNAWRGQVAVIHNSHEAAVLIRDLWTFAAGPPEPGASKWHGRGQQ